MSEKHLLLPSAKSGVLVKQGGYYNWVYYAALAVGLLVVLVGLADVTTRLSTGVLGDRVLFNAFAPLGALDTQTQTNVAVPDTGVEPPVSTAEGVVLPVRIKVPSIGVDAKVISVGKKADGTMGTPENFKEVAWYSLGAKPGEAGNAAFAGHVNNALTQAGVFSNLSKVDIGDYITLSDAQGKTLVYVVSAKNEYPADEAPAAEIFRTNGPSKIVLITCEGEWVPAERTFEKRLVVEAVPAYR